MKHFFKNYLSTLFFLLFGYIFYTHIPFYQDLLIHNFSFKFWNQEINSLFIFQSIIFFYIVLLIPFYYNSIYKSKARKIFGYIGKKIKNIQYKMTTDEQVSILSWAVKLFFAPLMIFWFSDHVITVMNNGYLSYQNIHFFGADFLFFFNTYFFYFALILLFFIDVFFFTIGYLFESKKLNNVIKSVDSTLFGWGVTLICYPPFNTYITQVIGWYSKDFPQFSSPYIHIITNITLLILLTIYASASISLGWKASNLTNRGIVKSGMYKYIRHPAYLSKNIVWWIGASPLLIGNALNYDIKNFLIVFGSMSIWSFIYFLRAITEEKHLSKDPNYVKYKKKVPYKFIPGII